MKNGDAAMRKRLVLSISLTLALFVTALQAAAADMPVEFSYDAKTAAQNFKKPGYSQYAGRVDQRHVFWGDTHNHTGLSGDAFGFGNQLGLDETYRFARGEEVISAPS